MANRSLSTEVIRFTAFEDGSGVDCIVDVVQGGLRARFVLNVLGDVEHPTCHGLGTGLTSYMTHKAADAARALTRSLVRNLGEEWLRKNAKMYAEG